MTRTKCLFAIAGIVAGLMTPVQMAFADGGNTSPVVPPSEESFPLTYGEWGAQWWQYVIGIPADENPINDPTGARCGLGQWGPVFFLVGPPGNEPTTRSCDVPAGAGLFFPIINLVCAVPEDGKDAQAIRDTCNFYFPVDPKSLSLTIDGKKVDDLKNFLASEFFSFTGATHGLFEKTGCAEELQPCYADFHPTAFTVGYWAMLRPLSPGKQHTVHFRGENTAFSQTVDATYHLKVVPQKEPD
jgi:hypothetical protein